MATIPYDDRDGFIWMDGKMLPWREASVHYLTHALHYGTLVFEGERAYNGKIFKSIEHSERLINSAKIIHMETPFSVEELEDIKKEVMEANNLSNAYIRVAAWRGAEQMGIDVRGTKTHLAVAAWDWGKYFDPKTRDSGITLATGRWRRPSPDSAPVHSKASCLYNLGCMAKYEAQQKGYHDTFMHDHEGFVAESSGANLFVLKDGELITPIADRFLNGITRQSVIQIAKNLGINVTERRIKPEEMETFDEVFVTGTAAEVTAIGKIDNIDYGGAGPLTKKLRSAYEDLVGASA